MAHVARKTGKKAIFLGYKPYLEEPERARWHHGGHGSVLEAVSENEAVLHAVEGGLTQAHQARRGQQGVGGGDHVGH
jgi:hypothetical protein